MLWQRFIKRFCLIGIINGCSVILCSAQSNSVESNGSVLLYPDWQQHAQLTTFFQREDIVGSPYLSGKWMFGMAVLSSHRVIPEIHQPLLFNYDKTKNSLLVVNQFSKIIRYPADSVLSFELTDGEGNYSFIKVPSISENFFLIPIIRSAKGYSLYKRILTRLIQADFSAEGYYTRGKRYDEYVDYFEYYLTFPGNSLFKKVFLKESAIRRVLKEESVLLTAFFSLHDSEVTEQSLLAIIQYINDRKYPE